MKTLELKLESGSVEQTIDIGRRLGSTLAPGDVIGLVGRLGAGKTYLVKGIAEGLGLRDARDVNSPTFALVNEYAARVKINHLDAYRLNHADELLDLGFEEMCESDAVTIVEWADRVETAMPQPALWISIDASDESKRTLTFRSAESNKWAALREKLQPDRPH
jgi:tRNA threonylcarbamoyladenosine biosynthesis protein TsaE